jgi:putative addiction module component (TIGR02574 family)
MTHTLAELIEGGLELGSTERERLADRMYESLGDDGGKAVTEAWVAEAERRDAEIEAGTAELRPWDETMQELKAQYVR